jgi:outer membrane protein assembly factor BamB
MRTPAFARLTAAVVAASLVGGCAVINRKPKGTPTVGDRIAVLVRDLGIAVDTPTAASPMALPPALANDRWTQSGGNAAKAPGHVALGQALGAAWTAQIGAGTSKSARLGGGPVAAGGKVFTIDTQASVRAFSLANGAPLWATSFGAEKGNSASLYGGGVATSDDGTRVYATNGLGYVAAIDASNGALLWTVKPGGALRGAPTVAADRLYVISQDNLIYALMAANGTTDWSNAAALEIAGVFGSGSPAVDRGTIVAGFSSGELNAYRYENGRQVWEDALSRTSISTAVAALSDIDADPVIADGLVYAVGQGGRMVALDLNTGQRVWELNVAGFSTPWVAGDWLFAVSDQAQLLAVQRITGKIRWIQQLAHWDNEKKKSGPIYYSGPVLAGGRLILAGSNGALVNVDPVTGAVQSQTRIGDGVSFQPIVADGSLILLTNGGRLVAYR